jgi:hypothetical protein
LTCLFGLGLLLMGASELAAAPEPDLASRPLSIDRPTLDRWSAPYRNWHYWPEHVVSSEPKIPGYEGFKNTDVPCIYQLPGQPNRWFMSFIAFDGHGYNSFVVESDDLVRWRNPRLAMGFGKAGEFDHGGCVVGAFLYESYGIDAPRILRRWEGRYWTLYGAYPRQGGYELRPGYEGVANSEDGLTWRRAKEAPILSVHDADGAPWEQSCIYQPWLVEVSSPNGAAGSTPSTRRFYNFYNAAQGEREQTGLAYSTNLLDWTRHRANPVVRNRPEGYDEVFASDPKVFREGDHWTMFYFGVGRGGAHIMVAFSRDLEHWTAHPEPLYRAGGHPRGLDRTYAHKISLVRNPQNDTYYLFYCAVGTQGRGIGLLTSRPLASSYPPVPLLPYDLRCDYETNPVGVDSLHPELSWKLDSGRRGDRQTAYQILVAASEAALARDEGDVWDSGRVGSGENSGIRLAGSALRSSQRVFWKVRVWDEQGAPSAWSSAAWWVMGVLKPDDWQAQWITAPPAAVSESPPGLPVFRKVLDLAHPVQRAVLQVTGLGHYELFLNGTRVGDRYLDPAWSLVEKTVYYSTYEISPAQFSRGRQVLALMLGKGFYSTAGDRRVHGVNVSRPLQCLVQLHLTFTNGASQVVVSDASWKVAPGPVTHSAILGGEDHDARRLPLDWQRPTFDDAGWAQAAVASPPGGELRSAVAPPLRLLDSIDAVSIDEPEPGVWVYDFGQNASAVPRLTVRGRAGQTVRLRPAEQRHGMTPRRNNGRGTVNPAGVGHPNYWEYTLRGDAVEEWTPQFTYSGFQYLQLEGGVPAGHPNPENRPVVESLTSMHVRNRAAAVGAFECSLPLFNDVDRLVDWAVRGNLSHVLTDCPHREKLGWLEVSYLMGPAIAGRYDVARFYRKIAQDCADSQSADGQVPTVAPAFPKFDGGFAYTPEWGAAAVINPWLMYLWYDDRRGLESAYPSMRRFVDYLSRTSPDLVPAPGLGDWYDYGHGHPAGPSRFTPTELSAMATFYRCSRVIETAAGVLGRVDDQQHYGELSRRISRAFNDRFFDGIAEYRNLGSPQTANSMAWWLGLVPAGRETATLERVIQDLRQRGNQQTSGDIGHWYLLQALAQGGRSDAIYDFASRTNLGSYGFIVQNGWTSMPEAWDADTGASMNHCMLGHLQEWFLGWVAGIRPDDRAPGFRRFLVEPHPVGDLTWARASYESIRGRIAVHWRRADGRFFLQVVIPPGTTATVRLPAPSIDAISENRRSLRELPLIQGVSLNAGKASFEVPSGSYEFRVQ